MPQTILSNLNKNQMTQFFVIKVEQKNLMTDCRFIALHPKEW